MKWLSFSFTGSVKLKGIIISGEDDDSHPAEIRLWVFDSSANLTLASFRLHLLVLLK